MAANVMEIYGSKVFNEHVMKERLPSATYKSLKNTLHKGAPLDIEVANVVASVMKRWAMELGATHYTHWFQPLTGITSEKHDGFVSPVGDGTAIMEFSGKELVRGEPDASSFPSGGLRATCEARGYTAWDPTSYAFVKDDVLCIPTAFVSYTGEALDKKTPLLRSMNALSGQAIRILKLFGKDVDYVSTTVGPEQEYFLVKKEDYEARQDLILTGRTLFGAPSAKGQELEEHYFGVIRPEVSAFMKELDEELWKLGVPAKTKHNEVAPCQHELAPIFDTTNVAIDHNLLTMEMMKKIAPKYGLVCLQHEKPFEGVNGSGKHNNWSMSTTHENLLDPGDTPMENLQFLVFLAAVIKAVDEYADLLRTSVATPGNDHRLGANEAPPAIISIFVGEELEAVIDAIASDSPYAGPVKMKMDLGVDVLPKFSKDTTDRNRTSPFAFTGNKFEFRMPGSAENLSDANTILNTAVAKELKGYADELEGAEDFTSAAIALIKRTIRDHRRVIFNGNGYTAEWEEEAARRGLPNKKNTPAALPALIEPKNIALMEEFGVLTKVEMESRYEVEMEHYSKIINIEALTMLEMARKQLLPAINAYMSEVANTAASKLAVSEAISVRSETKTLTRLSTDADAMSDAIDTLQDAVNAATRVIDDPQYELMTERFGTRMDRPGDVFWDLFRTGNVNREDGNKETIWALQYEFGVPGGQNGNIPTWNAGYPGERAWGPRYWTLLDPTGAAGTLACDSLGRGASYVRPTYYASTAVWKGNEKDMRNSEYNIKRNFYYNNPASSYYKQLITRENLFNEADTIMAFYPYIMKVTDYPHESDYAQAQSFRDVAVMRLAETYLLRAEAYLGMGRKDLAAADINELRKRAHAETMCTEAEVSIDYILDERTRELLTEEFRMLTLCRLGKLYERVVKYNDFKAGKTISEHNNLWAIPQNEIDANTDVKIENNPGY